MTSRLTQNAKRSALSRAELLRELLAAEAKLARCEDAGHSELR